MVEYSIDTLGQIQKQIAYWIREEGMVNQEHFQEKKGTKLYLSLLLEWYPQGYSEPLMLYHLVSNYVH